MAPLGHIHQAATRAGGIHRGGRLRSEVKLRGFIQKKTFLSQFTCLVSNSRKKSNKSAGKGEEEKDEEDEFVFGDLVRPNCHHLIHKKGFYSLKPFSLKLKEPPSRPQRQHRPVRSRAERQRRIRHRGRNSGKKYTISPINKT